MICALHGLDLNRPADHDGAVVADGFRFHGELMRAALLVVLALWAIIPAMAASPLERRIEAKIKEAFARYDILSRHELECSTLLVRKSTTPRVAPRISVPLTRHESSGRPIGGIVLL